MVLLVCEAFHCLPSEADAEMERLPAGTLLDLIQMRSFANALDLVERTKDWNELPKTPMVDLAQELITEKIAEELRARRGQA